MGRHKIWRNQIKKLRRKRLRQIRAQKRDAILDEERRKQELSPTYQAWVKEQDILEDFREEEEARLLEERNREWMLVEWEAQRTWLIRQERAEKARKEREEQELRIRKEWQEEQKKLEHLEMEKKKEQEEKQKKQDELMQQIVDFVERGGERPAFASDINESNPNMPPCPFFTKTGACRFGDRCSRNHSKPALSKIMLLPNFYSHFGMDQSMLDEYDTDLLLEYEDSETYQHFREFYNDVVPELFRYGQPVAVVICKNPEPHLRGNVYVEYGQEADAAKAVTSLNGRWYGGKLLSAQFTSIPSWKAAICGLYHRGKCPKGKTCNFLHIFHNPGREFANPDRERERLTQKLKNARKERRERDFSQRSDRSSHWGDDSNRENQRRRESSKREWRWSESPERPVLVAGCEVEMEQKSNRGRNGKSPDHESNDWRGKSSGSSRERREGEGEGRRRERREGEEKRREKGEERKSSRRSRDVHRDDGRHSGSRERQDGGNRTSHRNRRRRSRERSRGRMKNHSRHQRSSWEGNGVTENQESQKSGREKEYGANEEWDEEPEVLFHSERVSSDSISYPSCSANCGESQSENQPQRKMQVSPVDENEDDVE